MSSYFDEASLVMIPSGYKTSKLYSVKPTDGSGDMVVTRSNDTATRVGPDGLIEKVRTNLILQSEAFNTTWTPISSSVSANTTANPLDGAVNADTITLTGATTQKYIVQGLVQSGLYTYSVYAKAGTHNFIQLMLGADAAAYANFNISTGSVTLSAGATASIVPAGGGWYRCSISYSTTTANSLIVLAVDSGTDARFSTSASTGTFILFGAQAETSDIATDYIPTTSAAVSVGPVANVPRLDYLNSSCPRLLLEPQRTNLWINSESFSGGTESIVTYTANTTDTLDPAGYNGADKFAVTTSGGDAHTRISRTLAVQGFSVSLYVKGAAGQKLQLFLARDSFAEIKTAPNYTLNGNWQRLTFSDTFSTTSSSVVLGIEFGWTSDDSVAGQLYYVWGAQVETGAYATSYIPTLGAAVTRGADAASKTGVSSLIGQTEGTLFAEGSAISTGNGVGLNDSGYLFAISDNTLDNQISIRLYPFDGKYYLQVRSGGAFVVGTTYMPTSVGQNVKIAIAYKANDFAFYVNGTQIATASSGAVPALSAINFGQFVGPLDTIVNQKQALLFKTRLTNAQLAELTA